MELSEELQIFLVEAYENIDKVEGLLVELEKAPNNQPAIHDVFRSIHTIKGNSGFLGLKQLEILCHRAEAVLDCARNRVIPIDGKVISALLTAIDTIRTIFGEIEQLGNEGNVNTETSITELNTIINRAKGTV